jgi:hypothetical protein
VFEPLREQADDVLVVERVVHQPAVAPRTHEAHAPQQAKLMRHGRFAQAQESGEIADAQLRARERVEHADTCRVAKHLERFGECDHRRLGEKGALEPRRPRRPRQRGSSGAHRPTAKV